MNKLLYTLIGLFVNFTLFLMFLGLIYIGCRLFILIRKLVKNTQFHKIKTIVYKCKEFLK